MRATTARQQAILDWIVDFQSEHGMPPTCREIGRAFGIASSSVFGHLRALERKGLLRRGPLGARSLEVAGAEVGGGRGIAVLPEVGRVAAGTPLLAEENIEGMVKVDRLFLRSSKSAKHFILKVAGDSMIEAGILDGDRVIVRQQSTAENGEIVVALIDDEATVKRFYREKRRVRLQPENNKMKPIYAKEVEIQGVVVGVLRTFG